MRQPNHDQESNSVAWFIEQLVQGLTPVSQHQFEEPLEYDDLDQLDWELMSLSQSNVIDPQQYAIDSCTGCSYWCGDRSGGRLLVCAIHPFGKSNCPDFEPLEPMGDRGYPLALDQHPIHKYQQKVVVNRAGRRVFGSILHKQHHKANASITEGWHYLILFWNYPSLAQDILWIHESELELLP